jgi:hypothetical protein
LGLKIILFKDFTLPLCHIGFSLRRWPFGFPAFQATLSAQFQVFLLVFGTNRFSRLLADFAWFSAAFFSAKVRYVTADLLHVFGFQHGSVCAR